MADDHRHGPDEQSGLSQVVLLDEIAALQKRCDDLQARNDELERLLAPPPQTAAVVKVTYADGRVKYAARDGSKYTLPADALQRSRMIGLMNAGIATEEQARGLLARSEDIVRALTS